MNRIPAPEPGIYENVPAADYLAWDCQDQSSLKKILPPNTPADFKYAMDHPFRDTADTILGQGAHSNHFDGIAFEDFTIAPWKTACASYFKFAEEPENEGKHIILEGQLEVLKEMRRSFDEHELAPTLLKASDYREVSIVFMCGGIKLKARLDLCISKSGMIADGKKVQLGHAHQDLFDKDVTDRAYHIQAAAYMLAGTHIPDCVPEAFYFILWEDAPPYKVNVLPADQGDMAIGMAQLYYAIEIYKDCLHTGKWPAYKTDKPQAARLRAWKRKQLLNDPNIIKHMVEQNEQWLGIIDLEESDDEAG